MFCIIFSIFLANNFFTFCVCEERYQLSKHQQTCFNVLPAGPWLNNRNQSSRKPAGLRSSDSLLLRSERLSVQPSALMVVSLRIAFNIRECCSSFQATCWDWFISSATNQRDKPVPDGSRAHTGPEVKMESIKWRIWTMSTRSKDWSQWSFCVCTWSMLHVNWSCVTTPSYRLNITLIASKCT